MTLSLLSNSLRAEAKNGLNSTPHMSQGDWRLSDMANGMERSRILSIAASVRELIAQGKEVAPFTVGDFSPQQFDVPDTLIDGIIEAVREGETNYPPAAGLPELRESLAKWMHHKYSLTLMHRGLLSAQGHALCCILHSGYF